MAAPSDPCALCVPFCWTGWHEEIDGCIHPYDEGVHRAAVMRMVATEIGCDFADIRCVVRYARVKTRQEAWDEGGQDLFEDEWLHKNNVGYYFDTNDYRYDSILADGTVRDQTSDADIPAAALKKAHPPFPVTNPPADWVPPEGTEIVTFVKDPTLSYPTPVERVLVCET